MRYRKRTRRTYSDSKKRASFSAGLQDAGFQPGDPSASSCESSKWLISATRVMHCGGVLVRASI